LFFKRHVKEGKQTGVKREKVCRGLSSFNPTARNIKTTPPPPPLVWWEEKKGVPRSKILKGGKKSEAWWFLKTWKKTGNVG